MSSALEHLCQDSLSLKVFSLTYVNVPLRKTVEVFEWLLGHEFGTAILDDADELECDPDDGSHELISLEVGRFEVGVSL